MDTKQSYVSLFSSAGLGCYGFKLAGFECVATAELLPRRLEVQKANEVAPKESAYILGDLSQAKIREQLYTEVENWRNDTGRELTTVIATPPCQGMSVANHKKKDELARNSLVVHSLKIIASLQPRFFVLENVRAFLTTACDDDGTTRTIGEAIDSHLAGLYSIKAQVGNLKDFGSPSSRTRTLVIGVRRDLHDVTPSNIWPERKDAPLLKDLIYELPRLSQMGEISDTDIYHGFRSYDERMRPWIHGLKEGQSAFENTTATLRPHRIIDGKIVENKSSNGDKYRRNIWNKVAPCVHTRNDILASQSTVHPEDDRVFSIREISRMMGVPDTFKWANFLSSDLNELPHYEKIEFLRTHEINIRQCLGEGVPTPVFRSIAKNMAESHPTITRAGRPETEDVATGDCHNPAEFVRQAQPSNSEAKEYAAFYTRQDTVFNLLSNLVVPKTHRTLRILEPSAGAGAFLPELFKTFENNRVVLDIVDVNSESLARCRDLVRTFGAPDNFTINYLHEDFIHGFTRTGYDYIIGNPPFGLKGTKNPKFDSHFGIRDIYGKFIEKSLQISEQVALVIPKSFLASSEMRKIRDYISDQYHILAVDDYGEDAFSNINIETIGITISAKSRGSGPADRVTKVTSTPLRTRRYVRQEYISSKNFPSWIIYRNEFFDELASRLEFGMFRAYRDRKITKSDTGPDGDVAIIRARNIAHGNLDSKNAPVEFGNKTLVPQAFHKLVTGRNPIVVPNLSYYPRACYLPAGAYVDGSAAVLVPTDDAVDNIDLSFYSSRDFFHFYRIARNYSTRSLNVDSVSSFYWGVPTANYSPLLNSTSFQGSSSLLFKIPRWDAIQSRWEA